MGLISDREKLRSELKEILEDDAYIYGCGVVGKRLYDVILSINMENKIQGFIVSNLSENDDNVYQNKNILQLDYLKDANIHIIVAVSDAYQNEIMHLLHKHNFKNVYNGYLYSFLNEVHMPVCLPENVPVEFPIDLNELMIMQFDGDKFCAYDILLSRMQVNVEAEKKEFESSNIVVDRRMQIVNGRKSIADALCANKKHLLVKQTFEEAAPIFDHDWLESFNISDVAKAADDYLVACKKEWIKPLIGIIWPDAYNFAENILKDIESFAHAYIGETRDILFNVKDFESFVRRLYDTDDMDKWKIDMKLERMLQASVLKVKIFDLYLERTCFRIKRFGHTISSTGMSIKDEVRRHYKVFISNYIEDVVMHTTDNYHQSYEAQKLIKEYMQ